MIKINELKVKVDKNQSKEALISLVSEKYKISKKDITELLIIRKSLDARKKPDLFFIYQLAIKVSNEKEVLSRIPRSLKDKVSHYDIPVYDIYNGNQPDENRYGLDDRPIVVGAGPCGLFAAYELALEGYNPIVLERGKCIEDRTEDVLEFFKTNILNTESNVQFGEGGAGAFSDGKLNTSIKDPKNRIYEVLRIFAMFGADEDITYEQKPHIGTDVLFRVIANMRNKIIELGGAFVYNACVSKLIIDDNKICGLETTDGKVYKTNVAILCIGHSARDTFQMLYDTGVNMESKPFAVGFRVEHEQSKINLSQYGSESVDGLKNASYKLTHTSSNGRGVYSFCMCPGGYVVNSSSEKYKIAINGMSYRARDGKNSNSAVIVSVGTEDFPGSGPLAGIEYQRSIEKKAYELGNGHIPQQLFGDFENDRITINYDGFESATLGGTNFANLRSLFSKEINESFIEGMHSFGHKIKGFDDANTILSGVESRTSSPVRIIRNDEFESNIRGLFPCGEGAGYAGGITSAAIDGLRIAEEIVKRFKPGK